jgi:hypothetical protein
MPALLNSPDFREPTVEIELRRDRFYRGSSDNVWLNAKQMAEYNRDPDGFAARYLGYKTLEDYYRAVASNCDEERPLWQAFCSKQERVRRKARAELVAAGVL